MSMMAKMAATGGAGPKNYVDDVFSAFTYTGNSDVQSINNGIDLSGNGGVVWIKPRAMIQSHFLESTATGLGNYLCTNHGAAILNSPQTITEFNNNGYSIGASALCNNGGDPYMSWTFRKAPKFFDVVTYAGNGTSGRQIAHSLGITPGMIVIKCTSNADSWYVYHRSIALPKGIFLNLTLAAEDNSTRMAAAPTASTFTVETDAMVNAAGRTYVAYVFAHDASADGLIQCGSFTTDGGGNVTVNLGWEPQYILFKCPVEGGTNWEILDSSRGLTVDQPNKQLQANNSNMEGSGSELDLNATGFKYTTSPGRNHIYMAIRRSNKPPTSGTQVYKAISRAGNSATGVSITGAGFAPDLVLSHPRNMVLDKAIFDRLRGTGNLLRTNLMGVDVNVSNTLTGFDLMDGVRVGSDDTTQSINNAVANYIIHFFKRAVGVFDEVCYTGTGLPKTEAHNLGVVPELMIVKGRTGDVVEWIVYHKNLPSVDYYLTLNMNRQQVTGGNGFFNSLAPTASIINLGTGGQTNANSKTFVSYLFATKAGISKVGSYAGNASSQTINCGFAAGARFIMIKRTDAVGDWYVWDSVRGITASADPTISLNSTSAETTAYNSVDPAPSGFIVNQNTTVNINVNGAAYIYLAFA